MLIKKEKSIKNLLLSNHKLLKQIIIDNERKCTESVSNHIIKKMKNIKVEEIKDFMEKWDSREKFFDNYNPENESLFLVSIEIPKYVYSIKISTLKNKTLFRALSIEEEKRTITESLCN
ncbi:hypothetical protein IGC24_004589, partial [Salmonella enterica subsp. enterica serovar Heidelberg]|nr:hypothetical protein [Salmonella enterica]ECT1760964.1 hypothetical protein [Salmonella enterica subsp. enterica serovar Heidelberg]EED8223110.1 hypothetical protein [Salmonella enterica subsp. enterica serovar Braenderup]EAU2192112.1 hypothetical protein [Salmonella enterica]EBD5203680.1 hypothetical protein [Salmonella enterica]